MSYILEALKRSQEERELGTVPTLDSTPAAQAQRPQGRGNPWVLTALLLAALAIAVALYTLMNQGKAPVIQNGTGVTAADTGALESAPAPAPKAPGDGVTETIPSIQSQTVAQPPTIPPVKGQEQGSSENQDIGLSAPPTSTVSRVEKEPVQHPHEAVAQEPSQARSTQPLPSAPKAQRRDDEFRSVIQPLVEEESTVPPDLQEEIEAFKQRIKEERKAAAPATASTETEAMQISPTPAIVDTGEADHEFVPGLRALPPPVQSQIPRHRISVHVYSADPARRFVILNSRRMGEGDSSGDGLRLERIRPDGVVLNYGKHRFFSER